MLGNAPGLNYASDYRNVSGVLVPTKRRVFAYDKEKRRSRELHSSQSTSGRSHSAENVKKNSRLLLDQLFISKGKARDNKHRDKISPSRSHRSTLTENRLSESDEVLSTSTSPAQLKRRSSSW